MNPLRSLVAALLVVVTAAAGAQPGLDEIRDSIHRAVLSRDVPALQGAAERLAEMDAERAPYYHAYAHFRLGEIIGEDDKKRTKDHLNTCIDILKEVLDGNPDDVESLALQTTCYGTSSAYYMLRAATRGMASDKALERAKELAPDHPRVLMQEGVSLYFRPAAFGGDKEQALKSFQAAAEAFKDWQPPSADAPTWGEAETWLYLGMTYRDLEQPQKAREALKRALEMEPDYKLARQTLEELG